jgi:hypothetical protein
MITTRSLHRNIYPKSGNPSTIALMISSSSAFLLCAELVALVRGCFGGVAMGRGGVRVNADGVDVVEVERVERVEYALGIGAGAGSSKMDQGSSLEAEMGGSGAAVDVDVDGRGVSKMERSRS